MKTNEVRSACIRKQMSNEQAQHCLNFVQHCCLICHLQEQDKRKGFSLRAFFISYNISIVLLLSTLRLSQSQCLDQQECCYYYRRLQNSINIATCIIHITKRIIRRQRILFCNFATSRSLQNILLLFVTFSLLNK